MDQDYGKISREALARANAISETAISWSLLVTLVVVVITMIKGVFA